MSGHQQGGAHVVTRKKRRGMIEKRRRDKINTSLCELRRLVPAAFEKQGSAKLEKAEILQMTVDFLRSLHERGLADSLLLGTKPAIGNSQTNNQHLGSNQTLSIDDEQQLEQTIGSDSNPMITQQAHVPNNTLAYHHQQQHHGNQLFINQQSQAIDPYHHTSNQNHMVGSATNSAAAVAATAVAVSRHAGVVNQSALHQHHQSAGAHHHIYSPHHMPYHHHHHHHLSNAPLGSTSDMMMTTANQHSLSPVKNSASGIKVESHQHHQSSLVAIQHSHPGLLNLDHHQAHRSHNPLGAYGAHHAGSSLAMNSYFAASAAAAYPSMAATGTQLVSNPSSVATPAINTLHCQSISEQQQQSRHDSTEINGTEHQQMQPNLTQLPAGGSNGSPSLNDNSGNQRVSSSSSPSNSTAANQSSGSTNSQRHYRPWGTELAY